MLNSSIETKFPLVMISFKLAKESLYDCCHMAKHRLEAAQ